MTKMPEMDAAAERDRLRELLRKESLMFGDFTLASGRKSRYYFDSKKTTLLPEGAWLTARLVLRGIREAGIAAEGIGGLTPSSVPSPPSATSRGPRSGLSSSGRRSRTTARAGRSRAARLPARAS